MPRPFQKRKDSHHFPASPSSPLGPALLGLACLLLLLGLGLSLIQALSPAAAPAAASPAAESPPPREEPALAAAAPAEPSPSPTPAPTPTPSPEEAAAQKLEALREAFPHGAYWNHVGLEDWDERTVTQTPCDHQRFGYVYCNSHQGALQALFPDDDPMIQCLGFAALLSDLVFGEEAPVTAFTDYTQLRVGDHIRLLYTEHSMTVLTVGEAGVTVVECNTDYEHCQIQWDRLLTWEELAAHAYEMECTTRYPD